MVHNGSFVVIKKSDTPPYKSKNTNHLPIILLAIAN